MTELRARARQIAQEENVDPGIFERQIDQESGFNPKAHNKGSDASGIAQIVPRWHPNVDPWNPEEALRYAAKLLAGYLRHFKGSYPHALAAYNWGIGNVGGYTKPDGTVVPPWDGTRAKLPAETRRYLDSIVPGWDQAPSTEPDSLTAILERVILFGRAEIGKRYAGPIVGEPDSYRWGSPGWDCSSFVSAMYARATGGQVNLTPYTDAAYNQCEWVQTPQPGDIVFYHYDDAQAAFWPHMGIWLSPTEVLDARYGRGVGIGPHVTQVNEGPHRYRQTMRPKGLARVSVAPTPAPAPEPAPTVDPRAARITELEAALAERDAKIAELQTIRGYLTRDVAQALQAAVDTLKAHAPQ